MDEKKTPPQPSYIGMTLTCNECKEDCKAACKSGICKLTPEP